MFVLGFPLLVATAMALWATNATTVPAPTPMEILVQPKPVVGGAIHDHEGRPVDLGAGWSIWFSGYTRCPDVCPATLATLSAALRQLRQAGVTPPRSYFLSVDPADDAAALDAYLGYFGAEVRGVARAEGVAIAQQLGFFLPAVSDGATAGDAIAHAALMAVVDPRGRLYAIIRQPVSAADLASALRQLVGTGSSPSAANAHRPIA